MFAFVADSDAPAIKSGTATWTYERWDRGDWIKDYLVLRFGSFEDAWKIHNVMAHVWERGAAEGHHRLADKVIKAVA